MINLPNKVTIYEVGPRDGLQNEKKTISVSDKVELINRLSDSGLRYIEAGSFVSPKWVPQMADSTNVLLGISRKDKICYSALTPNLQGLNAAIDAKVNEVAVFAAASESFSQKNINCSIKESIERFKPVIEKALKNEIKVRAYVSCVIACPYEGNISTDAVSNVASTLYQLGCYQVSLGDTIGVGTPERTKAMIKAVSEKVPIAKLAIHCHDTYGQALTNIYASLQCGISTFDSSVAGLGGCPYAQGASGNVSTEDLIYLLNGLSIESGVDLDAIISIGNFISEKIGRVNQSKVAQALSQ